MSIASESTRWSRANGILSGDASQHTRCIAVCRNTIALYHLRYMLYSARSCAAFKDSPSRVCMTVAADAMCGNAGLGSGAPIMQHRCVITQQREWPSETGRLTSRSRQMLLAVFSMSSPSKPSWQAPLVNSRLLLHALSTPVGLRTFQESAMACWTGCRAGLLKILLSRTPPALPGVV